MQSATPVPPNYHAAGALSHERPATFADGTPTLSAARPTPPPVDPAFSMAYRQPSAPLDAVVSKLPAPRPRGG